MPKVFLSHSNIDSEQTLFVADSLRRAGFAVWVDFENIRGGADWLCEIEAGIQRCDALVIALTKASASSVWVERECLYAWQLGKPVFTALFADILIPLHLINIQYCDMRAQPEAGMTQLVASIHAAVGANENKEKHRIAAVSRQPLEANFFPYVEQLPAGDIAALVARDLFHWARGAADEVTFGGAANPGFQVRVQLEDKRATALTVRAFRRNPSAQIPLDNLARHAPYHRRAARENVLRALNRLLPKAKRHPKAKADGRPGIPLNSLSSAETLEAFKVIVEDVVEDLRTASESP